MKVDPHAFNAALAHEQAGRLDQAEQGYRQILAGGGEAAVVHYNLGNVLQRRGKPAAAAEAYRNAIALQPEEAFFHVNLGHVLSQLGDHSSATAAYRAALDLQPAEADLWDCLASACYHGGDDEGAAGALEEVLELDPERGEARLNLGHIRQKQGDLEAAADAFRRVLKAQPDNASVRHLLAAVSGREVSSAPARHVRETFDRLSDDYDRHLVETLEYRVPRRLAALLRAVCPPVEPFSNVLDLGCGTGISGREFHPLAHRLVGVDLSAGMIEKARVTGIYDRLETAEITSFLNNVGERFDLAVAADVFAYMGDLAPVFRLLAGRIPPGGLFLFSLESWEEADDWRLQPSGRFAHRRGYIEALSASHGFQLLACRRERLRREKGAWVRGFLFALRREEEA